MVKRCSNVVIVAFVRLYTPVCQFANTIEIYTVYTLFQLYFYFLLPLVFLLLAFMWLLVVIDSVFNLEGNCSTLLCVFAFALYIAFTVSSGSSCLLKILGKTISDDCSGRANPSSNKDTSPPMPIVSSDDKEYDIDSVREGRLC